jgi:hypothetical protein
LIARLIDGIHYRGQKSADVEPLLRTLKPRDRAVAFVPAALGGAVVLFLLLAYPTNQIAVSLLVAPFGGLAIAWLLLGWPRLARADGTPYVTPRAKPWFFFPVFILLSVFLYPFLGLALTPYVPLAFVVYAPLALAVALAGVASFYLVGFPPIWDDFMIAWGRVPAGTRPWLSVPAALALSLGLYFLVGWSLTAFASLPWAPLVAFPIALLAGAALAVLVFGLPRPARGVAELVPAPPGNARPILFGTTWFVSTAILLYAVGALLTSYAPPSLPARGVLPISVVVAAILSLGIAVLVWGTPAKWRRLPDYTPGVAPEVKAALLPGLWIVATLVLTVVAGLAGLDFLPSLASSAIVAFAVVVVAAGGLRSIRHRRPSIPEAIQPAVFFVAWVAFAAVLLLVSDILLPIVSPGMATDPTRFTSESMLAVLGGLALAFGAADLELSKQWMEKRARRRALRREIAEMRVARLGK